MRCVIKGLHYNGVFWQVHESNRRLEVTEKENKYFKDEVSYLVIMKHVTVNVLKF